MGPERGHRGEGIHNTQNAVASLQLDTKRFHKTTFFKHDLKKTYCQLNLHKDFACKKNNFLFVQIENQKNNLFLTLPQISKIQEIKKENSQMKKNKNKNVKTRNI